MTAEPGAGKARLPSLGSRGGGWVLGQVLLIFLEGLVSYPAFDALPPESPGGWLSMGAGAGLLLAGGWLVYRGVDALGSGLTPFPAPTERGDLVQAGIYRRIRHPIYAGIIALAAGWAFLVVSPWALAVATLLAIWLDLKSRREEDWLVERYPQYAAYRRRTSRFLPGVY